MEPHGKCKVLQLVSTLRRAGPAVGLSNLVKHVDRARFEVCILTLSPERGQSMEADIRSSGIEVRSLGLSRAKGLFCSPASLRAELERIRPDVIHSHGIRPDRLSAGCLGRYKRVSTLHNEFHEEYSYSYGRAPGAALAAYHYRLLHRLDRVVACGSSLAALLAERRGFRIGFVRNGVDIERFRPAPSCEKSRLRSALGLPKDRMIFVATGHLSARKDPLTLIRAFRRSGLESQAMLLVLYDGPLMARCRCEAQGCQAVRMTGTVPDVLPYLQASDLFVSASFAEGLPNAVLEAMACGLPLVLSEIPSHREILDLNPVPGLLFRPGDVPALSGRLRQAMALRPPAAGEDGRGPCDSGFTARSMASGYMELFQELMAGEADQ